MPLTFAQTEFALAFVTGIAPDRADAFQSRLKQWQKMGFPEGVNVGRGVKASYGAAQVFQLLFMLKLLRVGLTPERAQKVVLAGWEAIKDSIVETSLCLANSADHQHYCLIQLDALSDLKSGYTDHMHTYVELFTGDEIGEAFLEPDEEWPEEDRMRHQYFQFQVKNRLAISISMEVDSMLIMLWSALAAMDLSPDVFADDLREWHAERVERGRVAQPDEAHFEEHAARSIAQHVTNFDVRGAARQMLSKADCYDLDPQA